MGRFDTDEISAGWSTVPLTNSNDRVTGEGRDRFVSSLEALAEELGERSRVDDVLVAALEVQAEAQGQIDRVILSSAIAAQEFRRRLEELEAALSERDEALALARRQVSDRQQHADSLFERSDDLEADLKRLKRKYRAAQNQIVEQGRLAHQTQLRLAEAELALARYRRSFIWRLYDMLCRLLRPAAVVLHPVSVATRRKLQRERLNLIRTSPLFDANWYLIEYPDVAEAGIDPARHYLEIGGLEGRDPGPSFSSSDYLKANGDVARAGLNPLMHYIEHGHAEGRGTTDHRPSASRRIYRETAFGSAAPCLRFPVEPNVPVRWLRTARLKQDSEALFSAAGIPVGFVGNEGERAALRFAFERLSRISACSDNEMPFEAALDETPAGLLDSWYLSKQQLRTRWSPERFPVVVRAYQHDPLCGGVLHLIGEGLVVSEADFVDLSLLNPCFPLLFVLSEPDGSIRSTRLLAFPSLSRGGDHYAELIAFAAREISDAPIAVAMLRYSDMLAEQLLAIISGQRSPLIAALRIDLTAADGSRPLLQDDFQTWLANVIRIDVRAAEDGGAGGAVPVLQRAIEVIPPDGRQGGGELLLSADMIPSISVLTACQDPCVGAAAYSGLPLLVAEPDPSQPATLLNLPSRMAAVLQRGSTEYPPAWPQLRVVDGARFPNELTASAIRLTSGRSPSEAELLVPIMEPALPVSPRSEPIAWWIFAEDWDEETLALSLEALWRQRDSNVDVIMFIGPVSYAIETAALRLFVSRVRSFSDLEKASTECDTPLVGFLGPGVILHDRRSANVLVQLLVDSAAMSASCVLVGVEKRGKAWHVTTADPGAFEGGMGEVPANGPTNLERVLWRADYPVMRPSAGLWIARSPTVKDWIDDGRPESEAGQAHVCTSRITASQTGLSTNGPATIPVPDADPSTVLQCKVLFG